MDLSNLLIMRNEFYSDVESIYTEDIIPANTFLCAAENLGPTSTTSYGISIASQNLKQFLSYLIGVHQFEPLFSGSNLLLSINGNINCYETTTYDDFKQKTTINSKETFKFKPITATSNFSLGFSNLSYQGEPDEYVPFGQTNTQAVDTKLTATREEIKQFFQANYRSKFLRGTATFDLAYTYDKNYSISLIDKQVYLIIIGIQYNENGIHNYEALVLSRS